MERQRRIRMEDEAKKWNMAPEGMDEEEDGDGDAGETEFMEEDLDEDDLDEDDDEDNGEDVLDLD